MSPSTLKVVIIAVLALVDAFVVWRFMLALSRGRMTIDPLFWIDTPSFGGFEVTRARNPIFYWGGMLSLMLLGLVLFGVVVLTAFVAIFRTG
jgi:hypothetical protein